jgi:hypothetical protein
MEHELKIGILGWAYGCCCCLLRALNTHDRYYLASVLLTAIGISQPFNEIQDNGIVQVNEFVRESESECKQIVSEPIKRGSRASPTRTFRPPLNAQLALVSTQ